MQASPQQLANGMRGAGDNWRLESFIDALILELDRAQDTLSVKGINRKLTYSVRDVSIDLNVFPDYSDDELRFSVARPGDNGASRITFQLGSITDRQIMETTREPVTSNDVILDDVEELDPEVRNRLKRIGVTSARDLERMQQRDVALPALVRAPSAGPRNSVRRDDAGDRVPSAPAPGNPDEISDENTGAAPPTTDVSYRNLADIIAKARRKRNVPTVQSLSVTEALEDCFTLNLHGDNLDDPDGTPGYPMAVLHGEDIAATRNGAAIALVIPRRLLRPGGNSVNLAIDPTAIVTFDLKRGR